MTVWHGFMITPGFEDGVNMIAETATEIEDCFRTILEMHNASYKRVRENNTIVYYVWWNEAIDDSDEEFIIEPYTLGLNKWYIDRENNEE
jgi:hypothetical protein